MDFTLTVYKELLETLKEADYTFYRFVDYLDVEKPSEPFVIMRHDVDRRPGNALETAKIENDLGIKASYYFRIVKESFHTPIIKEIAAMGHEIGYHYEDITLAHGDPEKAMENFRKNLEQFHALAPLKTLCMHGSPVSKWDNREIWKTYNYRDFGFIGEPYYDIDFSKVLYLTDTGRRWNGRQVSVRDRVDSGFDVDIKTTAGLIAGVKKGELPQRIMFNIHPERWDDSFLPWFRQLVLQNTKNVVKRIIARRGRRPRITDNS
jgi:hypothetical protein